MKVSVIIPTYNRAELVQLTIDSVLSQTFTDYEIIVIDDESSDNTEACLERYANNIRYVKQINGGVNNARNNALKLAQGEYIALLDNDDTWFPWTLDLYVKVLDDNPDIAVAFSDFFVLKSKDIWQPNGLNAWFSSKPDWNNIYSRSVIKDCSDYAITNHDDISKFSIFFGDIYHSSIFGPRVLPSASLYRKSMAEYSGIRLNENDSLCGDWEFFAKLSHAYEVAYIDIEAAFNRSHEDVVRLTRTDHWIQRTKRLQMMDNTWKNDPQFLSHHRKEVENEEFSIAYDLFKLQIFRNNKISAYEAYIRMNKTTNNSNKKVMLISRMIMLMPGSTYIVIFLRSLLDMSRSIGSK